MWYMIHTCYVLGKLCNFDPKYGVWNCETPLKTRPSLTFNMFKLDGKSVYPSFTLNLSVHHNNFFSFRNMKCNQSTLLTSREFGWMQKDSADMYKQCVKTVSWYDKQRRVKAIVHTKKGPTFQKVTIWLSDRQHPPRLKLTISTSSWNLLLPRTTLNLWATLYPNSYRN